MKGSDEKKDKGGVEKESGQIRIEVDQTSDNFGPDEQVKIVQMIIEDAESDKLIIADWLEQRKKDIQMYEGERPSIIENLSKKSWMSDRNLGLCAATCDIFQATLLATCYNPDTLHFIDTEANDPPRGANLEKFAKWGLGKHEANFFPQVDDFVHNRTGQGVSYFHTRWEVKHVWVDRRIPRMRDDKVVGYDIKTERVCKERGVIENISDVGDLLFPEFGSNLQDQPHLIHVLHKTGDWIIEQGDSGKFINVDDNFKKVLKQKLQDTMLASLRQEKCKFLGITDLSNMTDEQLRLFPVDLFAWYGPYTKNGRTEEYRFIIEPITRTFLAGKPLRKITRSGKRPFVGGGLIRRPGFVRGKSVPWLTRDICNQFNSMYNQKSDFQYFENIPGGFYQPDEPNINKVVDMEPGKWYPSQDPKAFQPFASGRSMAWAYNDMQVLFELLERLTGAASYFMSNRSNASGTATRDQIIEQKSDVKFSLWEKRIREDIADAITMWIQMYQDWAPPDLGNRVLGKGGEKLFKNLSIETLQGNYDARLSPDIIAGSKAYEKQVAMWGYQTMGMSMWFNPQINPAGNWELTVETAKKMGYPSIEKMMPPKPAMPMGMSKSVEDKFEQIRQGDMPEIEPAENVNELFLGFVRLRKEKYDQLDPEYKPNFDAYMFKLYVAVAQGIQKAQQEVMANQMALHAIQQQQNNGQNDLGINPPQAAPQPAMPGAQPGGMPQ